MPRSAPPSAPTLAGTFVDGKYRIDELIATGGMGAVYRAEHVHLGKPVAIKVLVATARDAARRFYHEARVTLAMRHPHIVTVLDRGILPDGSPYLVMELLEGETLADRLSAQVSLSLRETLEIGEQILAALAAAHELGVIHRDLKPENVFLLRTGETGKVHAKLFDFGISRDTRDVRRPTTLQGCLVGTPQYVAPEQARGDRDLDHRVDLWAAGVVLYEMLTGRTPFDAEDFHSLLIQILQEHPMPLAGLRDGVPAALEAVILKALSKKPADRFDSASAMLDALRAASNVLRASGPRAGQTPHSARASRARRSDAADRAGAAEAVEEPARRHRLAGPRERRRRGRRTSRDGRAEAATTSSRWTTPQAQSELASRRTRASRGARHCGRVLLLVCVRVLVRVLVLVHVHVFEHGHGHGHEHEDEDEDEYGDQDAHDRG